MRSREKNLHDIADDVLLQLDGAADRKQSRGKPQGASIKRIARSLASLGRGGDTEIAHLTIGEVVLPSVLQTPEVMLALRNAAVRYGLPLARFRVGASQNKINPRTGVREFDDDSTFDASDTPGVPALSERDLAIDPNVVGQISTPLPQSPVMPSTVLDRFETGVADPYYGAAQLVGKATGTPIDQKIIDRENAYREARAAAGATGWDIPRTLGRMAGLAPAMIGAPEGIAGAAAMGALKAAVEPAPTASPKDFWLEKLKSAVGGAALGGSKKGAMNLVTDGMNAPLEIPNPYSFF